MTDEKGPLFGEQGGRLTYGSYLRIPQLLELQVPESSPPAHDELLFITIHQVYELWFKLMLHELTNARDRMLEGESYLPRVRLERCQAIERVLIAQVDVIDTMTPQDFLVFREKLAPASGFQSVQFREIEFLSGMKDPGYLDRFRGLTEVERARLRSRLEEPSLWDGFLALLAHHGFSTGSEGERATTLKQIAHDRESFGPLWD
nr:tryptophan 2,3-dioxygenase [Longispora sp. (in: high G+C Gram-positive bacteria)]